MADLPEQDAAAALAWIVGVLQTRNIPFQITGGLAARVYGSTRPLADIDIDVPEEFLPALARALTDHVVFGPERLCDEEWDLDLLTVGYAGWRIDLGGAHTARVFDRAARAWVPVTTDLTTAARRDVLGIDAPVVAKGDLIAYKRVLGRDVDRIDVVAME